MKAIKIFFILSIVLLVSSCSNRETIRKPINIDRIHRIAEANAILAELDDLIEDLDNVTKNPNYNSKYCGKYTVQNTPTAKKISFNFQEQCSRRKKGNVRGKLILVYEVNSPNKPILRATHITFENFSIDGVKIQGNETRKLTRQGETPTHEVIANIEVIWKDNTKATYKGTRLSRKVKGAKTATFVDDEYLVEGDLDVKLRDNKPYTLAVKTPLLRKAICRFYVSGRLHIKYDNEEGILDYGDGACDNKATFTHTNGKVETVILK